MPIPVKLSPSALRSIVKSAALVQDAFHSNLLTAPSFLPVNDIMLISKEHDKTKNVMKLVFLSNGISCRLRLTQRQESQAPSQDSFGSLLICAAKA